MEKEYAQSVYVNSINGGVMVVADGEMDRSVLVAQANLVEIEKLAAELKIEGSPLELCRNAAIEKAVLADLIGTAMKNLSPLEKIVAGKCSPLFSLCNSVTDTCSVHFQSNFFLVRTPTMRHCRKRPHGP